MQCLASDEKTQLVVPRDVDVSATGVRWVAWNRPDFDELADHRNDLDGPKWSDPNLGVLRIRPASAFADLNRPWLSSPGSASCSRVTVADDAGK
jgi:hypothetical protein